MSNYNNGSNNNNNLDVSKEMRTLASINVHQIADWTSGEVITEQKFEETFSLIGSVINNHFYYIDAIIKENKGTMRPSRFLGRADTLIKLDPYINELNKSPDFAIKPAPSAGDVIQINRVEVNELPQYLQKEAGSYIYVYVEEKKGEGFWKLFVRVFDPENDIVNKSKYSERTETIRDYSVAIGDIVYKRINDFPISTWNGLTKEQIYNAVAISDMAWGMNNVYPKNVKVFYVDFKNFIRFSISLIDNNKGNDPATDNGTNWKKLSSAPIDVSLIIEQLKPYINDQITMEVTSQLDNLKTIKNVASMASVKEFSSSSERDDYIARAKNLDTSLLDSDFTIIDELEKVSEDVFLESQKAQNIEINNRASLTTNNNFEGVSNNFRGLTASNVDLANDLSVPNLLTFNESQDLQNEEIVKKQNKLVAGSNITINPTTNEISVKANTRVKKIYTKMFSTTSIPSDFYSNSSIEIPFDGATDTLIVFLFNHSVSNRGTRHQIQRTNFNDSDYLNIYTFRCVEGVNYLVDGDNWISLRVSDEKISFAGRGDSGITLKSIIVYGITYEI